MVGGGGRQRRRRPDLKSQITNPNPAKQSRRGCVLLVVLCFGSQKRRPAQTIQAENSKLGFDCCTCCFFVCSCVGNETRRELVTFSGGLVQKRTNALPSGRGKKAARTSVGVTHAHTQTHAHGHRQDQIKKMKRKYRRVRKLKKTSAQNENKKKRDAVRQERREGGGGGRQELEWSWCAASLCERVCACVCVCAQTIIAMPDKEGELERKGASGRSQCPGTIRRTESHSRRLAEHMTYDGEWEPFSLVEHGGWTTCQQVFDLILAVILVLFLVPILAVLCCLFTSRATHKEVHMQYGVHMLNSSGAPCCHEMTSSSRSRRFDIIARGHRRPQSACYTDSDNTPVGRSATGGHSPAVEMRGTLGLNLAR